MIKKGILLFFITFCFGQNGYFGSISFDYSGSESGTFLAELTDSTFGGSLAVKTSNANRTTIFISAVQPLDSLSFSTVLIYFQTPDSILTSGTWTFPPDDLTDPNVVFGFLPVVDSTFINQLIDLIPDSIGLNTTFLDSTFLQDLFFEVLQLITANSYLGISGTIRLNHISSDSITGIFNLGAIQQDIPPKIISISNGMIQLNGVVLPQVAIEYDPNIPDQIMLYPAYPNPFNPTTTIRFKVGRTNMSPIHINIFDINGRLVETLVNDNMPVRNGRVSGEYEIIWNASNRPSGMYFVQLSTEGIRQVQKVILMK